MMPKVDLHITRPEEFWQVLVLGPRVRKIKVDLQGVAPTDRARIEHRLAQLARPCGCTEGAIAMIIAIAAMTTLSLFGWPDDLSTNIRWTAGLLVVVLAAVIGKGIGIFRGRAALRNYVGGVVRQLGPGV